MYARVDGGARGGRARPAALRACTCGSEAGSYLRRLDSCITQLKAQGPPKTCNENEEEDEDTWASPKLTKMEAREEGASKQRHSARAPVVPRQARI